MKIKTLTKFTKDFICICLIFIFFITMVRFQKKSSNENCFSEDVLFKRQMKGPLSSFDEKLINEVRRNHLIPPSLMEYNLLLNNNSTEAKKYNDKYQVLPAWRYLQEETRILFPKDRRKNGFYVEVGAFDGEYFSNSLFLEMEYGWNGLLIEPDIGLFKSLLRKNRKAWASNCCLSSNPYPHETVLSVIDSNTGDIVALHDRIYNSISESRTNVDRNEFGVPVYETVQCIPLHTLLLALNRTHVDLIYLDVEDVEVDLLKHFAWTKINVDVWIVEHRNPKYKFLIDVADPDFVKWFEKKGYVLYKIAPYIIDYIFVKRNSTYFLNNHQRLNIK